MFAPGWRHPRRLLTSSVLLLGVRGEVPLLVEEEPCTLLPGRVVVLPAGVPHAGASVLVEPASYFWLHFTLPDPGILLSTEESDTILASEGVSNHRLEEAALLPLCFDLAEPEPVWEEFRGLLNQQERPSYTPWKFQLQFQSLLVGLTERVIAAHSPPPTSSSTSSVVYGILACIAENLTDSDLSIKSIARALGLNLDYAGRRFKQVMGLSVGHYILRERLQLATVRLQETSETLEAIAQATGFGTLRHFLRQFKAQTGMTPTQVRNRHRMMHFNSF